MFYYITVILYCNLCVYLHKGEYCEPPAFGGHVTISKPLESESKFLDGASITFECKSGYEPVDSKASKLVTCVDTQWTKLQLACKGNYHPYMCLVLIQTFNIFSL